MALRAKKEALRAKKEVDENYHESYAAMVSEFGGIPDMPRDVSLEPHIHDGRAKSRVDHELVTKEDLAFEFNQTERSTGYRLKSFIINAQFVDGPNQSRVLSYHNEATVADYVQGAVNMCLKSMGYYKKGFLMKEMSLFSLRPDLILVKHETHGIVLIIEVKMPGDELELSEGIAKQLSDYLLIQYRLGNCTPFVLLSSYREARLCHLDSDIVIDNDNDADNEHRYREIVTEAARLLHNDHDFNEDFGTEEPIQDNKPTTYSPAKVAFASNSLVPTWEQSTGEEERQSKRARPSKPKIKIVAPGVVYSDAFDLRNMVHGVSLSIACGVVSLMLCSTEAKDKGSQSVWPDHSSSIDGLHPMVDSTSFNWVVAKDLIIDYEKEPQVSIGGDGTSRYLLLREIGRGRNGKVFLSVDCDGAACALKVYCNSKTYAHMKRADNYKEVLKGFQEMASEECRRWYLLQGDYAKNVRMLQLNYDVVLQLPALVPLPADQRLPKLDSGAVRDMLLRFFEKGYVCREVRWQQIGCRMVGAGLQLCLLDMESLLDLNALQKLDKQGMDALDLGCLKQMCKSNLLEWLKHPSHDIIDYQVEQLRARSGTDPVPHQEPSLLPWQVHPHSRQPNEPPS